VVALDGAVGDGGALEDAAALEDTAVLEDGGVVEDGGAVSGGGDVLVAIGAACGCGVTPDTPLAALQPVVTTMTPAIQASSKRIRITHLVEFSIGDRPPRAEGRSAAFHRNPKNIRVCLVCSPTLISTSQRAG
jgi:hypothetical protein